MDKDVQAHFLQLTALVLPFTRQVVHNLQVAIITNYFLQVTEKAPITIVTAYKAERPFILQLQAKYFAEIIRVF